MAYGFRLRAGQKAAYSTPRVGSADRKARQAIKVARATEEAGQWFAVNGPTRWPHGWSGNTIDVQMMADAWNAEMARLQAAN